MTSPSCPRGWEDVAGLAEDLLAAWGCWAPTLTADGSRVAYISDRTGTSRLWVSDAAPGATPVMLDLSDDPVVSVHWSPDGAWLAACVATGGGVRTEVWVVRPDGSDARRVAGGDHHAVLGPWARQGHELVVTLCSDRYAEPNRAVAIDPVTGEHLTIAVGGLISVMDLTADGNYVLVRDGTRGAQFCRMVNRETDRDYPVLPYQDTGSTEVGMLRPAPPARPGEEPAEMAAYIVTDAGVARRELLAVGLRHDASRIAAGALAARDDAEVEFADADSRGATVLVVWNVDGMSEVDLVDTFTGTHTRIDGLPGQVVSSAVLSRDGRCAALCVEGPDEPRAVWIVDTRTLEWQRITDPSLRRDDLVTPQLVRFEAHDEMPLSGWLYPAVGPIHPRPGMISLHGGPEAQERPVFSPQHQVMAAAGITVFAPNIRGSSGYGKAFVHADDRYGRFNGLVDIATCAQVLIDEGWIERGRLAVTGRSYGGYATLMALIRHGEYFAAGVDICGMSDLETFFRDSEPWIAAAAVSKYGHPVLDQPLLAELSPLRSVEKIDVPLLVVHGELDTNVPLNEATQLVERMTELGKDVRYLQLDGEGHEYRRVDSRRLLLRSLTEFLTEALDIDPTSRASVA